MNLDDLYQEIILDHFQHPRHAGPLPEGAAFAEGVNPNCGDVIQVSGELDEEIIRSILYHAKGCAVSIASASIMSEHLMQMSRGDAQAHIDAFEARIKDGSSETYAEDDPMSALLTVKKFPMRVKCATLPWTAMRDFLNQ